MLQEAYVGRRTDPVRVERIAEYIEHHPGSRPADIARALETSRSSITRALPALEDTDHLLSEDRRGRLWPFRR